MLAMGHGLGLAVGRWQCLACAFPVWGDLLGSQAIWRHGFALVVVWFLGPMWPWPGMATGATIKCVSPNSCFPPYGWFFGFGCLLERVGHQVASSHLKLTLSACNRFPCLLCEFRCLL